MSGTTTAERLGSSAQPGLWSGVVSRLVRVLASARVPLLVFAVSRVVDTVLLVLAAEQQDVRMDTRGELLPLPVGEHASYADVITNWDGQWYRQIAESGYPTSVPTAGGEDQQNALIFLPLFPALARLVMEAAGLPFAGAATVVSVVSAAVGVCVVHHVISARASRWTALMSVVALCFHPAAVSFQLAYTEGLALLLLSLVLLQLHRRHPGSAAVLVLLLGLTRAVTLPLALVVVAHAWVRWRRRAGDPVARREWVGLGAALVACPVGFLLWPFVVGIHTGVPAAYLQTRRTWFPAGAPQLWWRQVISGDVAPLVVVAAGACLLAVVLLRPAARVWPAEHRVWAGAYAAYLVVATGTGGGIFRYTLLMVAPLWPLPRRPGDDDTRGARMMLLGLAVLLGVASQWFWVTRYLVVGPSTISFP